VRGESVFQAEGGEQSAGAGFDQVFAREPTPAFAAEMVEQMQRRLDELQGPLLREIAVGKLQGYTHQELASQLDISLRSVERKLSLIRRKWSEDSSSI
jgi:DNA-directed RNA polymerase specialized sigma24 family protein